MPLNLRPSMCMCVDLYMCKLNMLLYTQNRAGILQYLTLANLTNKIPQSMQIDTELIAAHTNRDQ